MHATARRVMMAIMTVSVTSRLPAQEPANAGPSGTAAAQTIGGTSVEYLDDLDVIVIRGKPEDVQATQKLFERIAFQTQTVAQLSERYESAERRAAELATILRLGESERARQDLADAVRMAFQLRQRLQRKKIVAARLKLTAAEERLERRDELEDAIVRRRMDELVSTEDLSWRSAPGPNRSAPSQEAGSNGRARSQQVPGSPTATGPTYDGRTLAQWLLELQSERKPERMAEAVRALMALADKESIRAVTEAIFRSMRRHGANAIDDTPRGALIAACQLAIWQAPPEVSVAAMIREMQDGNARSRRFMVWMLYPPFFQPSSGINRTEVGSDFRNKLLEHTDEIISLLREISQSNPQERDWAIEFLARYCDALKLGPRQMEVVIAQLQGALPTDNAELTLAIAKVLTQNHPETPGLVESLAAILRQVDVGDPHSFPGTMASAQAAVRYLGAMGPQASAAVPELLRLLQDLSTDPNSSRVEAFKILETLGQMGPAAKSALPVLQTLVRKRGSAIEKRTRRAIGKILGSPSDASRVEVQIMALMRVTNQYRIDLGNYPTSQQGLEALRAVPSDVVDPAKWRGPYLNDAIEPDPWGTAYQYERTGPDKIRIWSFGPDRQDNTGDELSVGN